MNLGQAVDRPEMAATRRAAAARPGRFAHDGGGDEQIAIAGKRGRAGM
jgi:hypothetical protein